MTMDAGDAFWLVWVSGRRKLVYPCKVVEVKSATGGAGTMVVRSYQDNGYMEEEVTLRSKARYDESQIRAATRQHLDWAVRTTALPGEVDFKVSALAAAGGSPAPPAPGAEQPGPSTAKRAKQQASTTANVDLEQRLSQCEERAAGNSQAAASLAAEVAELRGKFDAWDGTIRRMQDYMRQQGMLAEEVRMLKQAAAPSGSAPAQAEAGAGSQPDAEGTVSDPVCCTCRKNVAYDMPMRRLLESLKGDTKLTLSDLFSPSGAVKAKSPLKKLVQCNGCLDSGALKMVVCTSGGAGNRLQCDWCRCLMTSSTTDAKSMWCGAKAHSNCRGLVIENETNRQNNTLFLTKGMAVVKEVVPFDEVKLVDVGLEAWNDADYVIMASSPLGKALVVLEIDSRSHKGGGQYTPSAEQAKNDGNFAAGRGHDRILFIRINPSGEYTGPAGETENVDKRARWLIARDWIVTFLRAPYGAWAYPDRTLVYLFYDSDSNLIDRRPDQFHTEVAYHAPGLPPACADDLSDFACALDPYLVLKGSKLARECLALDNRHPTR